MSVKSLHINVLAALFCTIFCLSWFACKNDDDDDMNNNSGPACNISNPDLSYNKNMKSIVDEHCLSCHGGFGPGPGDYSTYNGMLDDLRNGKILESVVIDKTMPQSGIMPQSARDSVNCWIKTGFLE